MVLHSLVQSLLRGQLAVLSASNVIVTDCLSCRRVRVSVAPARPQSGACHRACHSRSLLSLLGSICQVPRAPPGPVGAIAGKGRTEGAGATMQAEAGARAEGWQLASAQHSAPLRASRSTNCQAG